MALLFPYTIRDFLEMILGTNSTPIVLSEILYPLEADLAIILTFNLTTYLISKHTNKSVNVLPVVQ